MAGNPGHVVELTDPAGSDEWIVVRFGQDELPFSPGDLAVPRRRSAVVAQAVQPVRPRPAPVATAARPRTAVTPGEEAKVPARRPPTPPRTDASPPRTDAPP